MHLTFNLHDPSVASNRWIVVLSDGTVVFDDIKPGMISAWRRLGEYIRLCGLHITELVCEAYGHSLRLPDPDKVDGYWHSKRVSTWIGTSIASLNSYDYGIGYIKNGQIHITWFNDSGSVSNETRVYNQVQDEKIGAGILHVNYFPAVEA